MVDDLGFYPVSANLGILDDMQNYSAAVLFMGLIFDIIILLFVIIAILLIHSLLMISVETKTFEIGVMRMIGLSKKGIIFMVIIQAFLFVLPALIIGIAASFPALWAIYSNLFGESIGIKFDPVPSASAFLQALAVGILIPLFSSVIPIQSAMGRNLSDALDYNRSKTQAVYV